MQCDDHAIARGRGACREPAALGVTALVIGSTGYLINLLARWTVVVSDAAGLQMAVEA